MPRGREGHGRDRSVVHDAVKLAPGFDIPQADGAIAAPREDATAFGGESDAVDRLIEAREGFELPAVDQVPEPHGPIEARGEGAAAVG